MLKHSGQDCTCAIGTYCRHFEQEVDQHCINICRGYNEQYIEEYTYDIRNAIKSNILRQNNEIFECTHLGQFIRHEKCKLCGGKDFMAKVFQCNIHSECTIRSHGLMSSSGNKIHSCITCDDREAQK